jgi:DNA-binding NtrC family response regulator
MDTRSDIAVLVVDDERLIRWSLGQALLVAGLRVCEAADGDQALDLVRQNPPDVVLLDLRMPGTPGTQVLRRLHREYPLCRVVILSAHCTPEQTREALRHGASLVLDKPFAADQVVASLLRLVEVD